MSVYIDTSALIALIAARDVNHRRAVDHLKRLEADRERILCGWHTVIEFIDGLAKRQGQKEASRALTAIHGSRRLHVVGSEPYLDDALHAFSNADGWDVDISDCLSFALMHAHGCRRAFTFDRDFDKAGFQREP